MCRESNSKPKGFRMHVPPIEERIRRRAYDLWLADQQAPGRDQAHWMQAEREVLAEVAAEKKAGAEAPAPRKRAARKTSTRKSSSTKKK